MNMVLGSLEVSMRHWLITGALPPRATNEVATVLSGCPGSLLVIEGDQVQAALACYPSY
jgi:hypothetical protein